MLYENELHTYVERVMSKLTHKIDSSVSKIAIGEKTTVLETSGNTRMKISHLNLHDDRYRVVISNNAHDRKSVSCPGLT